MADLIQGEPDLLGKDLLGILEVAYSFAYDDKRTESTLRSLGKVDFGSSVAVACVFLFSAIVLSPV